jgi:hypothetical protein
VILEDKKAIFINGQYKAPGYRNAPCGQTCSEFLLDFSRVCIEYEDIGLTARRHARRFTGNRNKQ